jgi:O-antigen ligase
MLSSLAEKTSARTLAIGASAITLFLLTGSITDPVNGTKLFLLGGMGVAVFAITLVLGAKSLWREAKVLVIISAIFLTASISAVFASNSPFTQNLYGVYGRNTGFLTYLLLLFVTLSAALLRDIKSFNLIIYGLLFAAGVNVLYCGWALAFGDFIGWSNPYGNILGTFGNPDFISAFLGISITAAAAIFFRSGLALKYRIILGLFSLVAFYEIVKSHAIQGRAVTVAGLFVVGFFVIRSRFSSILPQVGYVVLGVFGGGIALAGALQVGPLTKYIYKTSVSLRGQYWLAGINMGRKNPLTGVGMDSYGDNYRAYRDAHALVLPGKSTVSNAAHNVVIDFFASGGWPLLLSYLALITLTVVAIVRVALRKKQYDATFVALAGAWLCYQLQSVISINQVGLAMWGWLLGGTLIAYERATLVSSSQDKQSNLGRKVKPSGVSHVISPGLIAGIGAVIGLFVSVPVLASDMSWYSALKTSNYNEVAKALNPSYLHPQNSLRYEQGIDLLEKNKLFEQSHSLALTAVKFNPQSYNSWYALYQISTSTPKDKALALQNMKRLDPLNPDVTKP